MPNEIKRFEIELGTFKMLLSQLKPTTQVIDIWIQNSLENKFL